MKKFAKNVLRKCVACVVCAAMLVSNFAINTFAAETNSVEESHSTLVTEPTAEMASARATSMYLGNVRFTGENTGMWRTVGNGNATHVRMCIAFKPVDGIDYSTELFVYLYQYPNVYIGRLKCTTYTTEPDADGYYFFVSEYFTISPGSDCRLEYLATSSGTTYNPRTVDVHAWYDYY